VEGAFFWAKFGSGEWVYVVLKHDKNAKKSVEGIAPHQGIDGSACTGTIYPQL